MISARTLRRHFPEIEPSDAAKLEWLSRKNVDATLDCFNSLIEGCGIECIEVDDWLGTYWQNIRAVYVNREDSYRKTLLFDAGDSRFRCTSMGEFVEFVESKGVRVR